MPKTAETVKVEDSKLLDTIKSIETDVKTENAAQPVEVIKPTEETTTT